MFFQMGLDLPEPTQKLVVFKDFKVLNVVVGLVVTFELLFGLTWVNAFENAQLTEVLERKLHFPDRVASCKVLGSFSFDTLFYFLHFN